MCVCGWGGGRGWGAPACLPADINVSGCTGACEETRKKREMETDRQREREREKTHVFGCNVCACLSMHLTWLCMLFKSKFVPVGTIPSNQTPFFFYPTNVNWQLDQTKKNTAQKQNWQFGERQKFARSSCHGFVAQWLERPTGNRKTWVWSPAGLRCVFFRLIQLSVHICRIEKERSMIRCACFCRFIGTSFLSTILNQRNIVQF